MNIIRLTSNNIDHYRALMRLYALAFDDHANYVANPPSDDYIVSMLKKPHFIALIAIDKDSVIGGLCAYTLDKFEQQRSEVYIYDLAVAEHYRRRGIATALINKLRPIGKETGASVIFVQAEYSDNAAVQLYQSLGIRQKVLHFDISTG